MNEKKRAIRKDNLFFIVCEISNISVHESLCSPFQEFIFRL